MHRTVIERIGVYHYRATAFLPPFSVAAAPRQLSIAYSGKLHGDLEEQTYSRQRIFGKQDHHFVSEARNDDFRTRHGLLRGLCTATIDKQTNMRRRMVDASGIFFSRRNKSRREADCNNVGGITIGCGCEIDDTELLPLSKSFVGFWLGIL